MDDASPSDHAGRISALLYSAPRDANGIVSSPTRLGAVLWLLSSVNTDWHKGTEWQSRSQMVASRLEALPPLVPPGLMPSAVHLISCSIRVLNTEDQGQLRKPVPLATSKQGLVRADGILRVLQGHTPTDRITTDGMNIAFAPNAALSDKRFLQRWEKLTKGLKTNGFKAEDVERESKAFGIAHQMSSEQIAEALSRATMRVLPVLSTLTDLKEMMASHRPFPHQASTLLPWYSESKQERFTLDAGAKYFHITEEMIAEEGWLDGRNLNDAAQHLHSLAHGVDALRINNIASNLRNSAGWRI